MSVCKICSQEFKSDIALKNHMIKETDCKHQLAAYMYKNAKIKCKDINAYIDKYKDFFDAVNDEFLSATQEELVQKIKDDVLTEKRERDFQKRQEKEQERIEKHMRDMQRLAEIEEKHAIERELEDEIMKSISKGHRPKALLKMFYDMIDSKSYNYVIEISLLRQLYTKYKLSEEKAVFVVKYMAKMGYANLRSINYHLQEALECQKYMKLINKPNTIPYMIKYFYSSFGMPMNFKIFMREVRRIHSAILTNKLSMEQVKNVLDGMVSKDKKTLMWFDSYINEYAYKSKSPIHNYTKEREIFENVNEVMNGKMTVDDIGKDIRSDCISILKDKYMSGAFNSEYNYFEWAFKIKLPLDKEMLEYGKKHNHERNNRFQEWHRKLVENGDKQLLSNYDNTIVKFNQWIENFAS